MRILLRKHNNEEYVWKDAIFKDEHYYLNNENERVYETEIVSVDGAKKGYVICNNCGAIIEDDLEKIKAHYLERENSQDCTSCTKLKYESNKGNLKRTLEKYDNGKYHVVEDFVSSLYCGMCYGNVPVSEAANACTFFKCRKAGVRKPDNIFSKYPEVFDSVITSDVLIGKKFRFDNHDGRFFLYDMKSRGTIKACVNNLGIVECFRVSSNGNLVYFYYSEKYDKMFYNNGSAYREGHPYWFKETKFEEAKAKIKALYEGVK